MLTFNLKKQWYDKIASGEKRIEYREVKPYWTVRLKNAIANSDWEFINDKQGRQFVPCRIVLGYTKRYMTARVKRIKVVDGKDTDLKIDKPVYAIHLAEVSEAYK